MACGGVVGGKECSWSTSPLPESSTEGQKKGAKSLRNKKCGGGAWTRLQAGGGEQ